MDVLHTALWVSDLETTADFYSDVFDLERSQEFVGGDGVTNYFVRGEGDAEIQFKHDEDADIEVDPGTMDHHAIAVEDVDATVEHAVDQWDSTVVAEPRDVEELGLRIAFVTDPDGYTVEAIQEL